MTIAAISTPRATGGIGIIRISGDDAITIADKIFEPTGKKRLTNLDGYTCAHGHIVSDGEKIDECIATVFREPKSYTGENVVEFSCHGGLFVLKETLKACFEAGAIPAKPGEFTKRAFLNGKIDLTKAEAVMDLISARGKESAKAAISTLDGALSKRIDGLCEKLLFLSAQMGAWVDYPDDEIEEIETDNLLESLNFVKENLERLLKNFDSGAIIRNGIQTAIIGKPNVGKSALMNQLSGFERSIVTEIAGTTRDIVEGSINLGGLTLHLCDTAGIHETDDIVENIGVEKAKKSLETARLVLAIFDGSKAFEDADTKILELAKGKRAIALVNKSDLEKQFDDSKLKDEFEIIIEISAKNGDGISTLQNEIEKLLCISDLDTSRGMLSNERRRKNATDALASINEAIFCTNAGMTLDAVNVCIDDAISFLLDLTGKKTTDAVVDEVFKNFCVGK